jgi:hypothetical protein
MAKYNASVSTSSVSAGVNNKNKVNATVGANSSLSASVNPDKKIVPVTLASTSTTLSELGLGNVTNESKATMFNNPAFTGIPTAPTADSPTNTTQIATTAFVQQRLTGANIGSLIGLTDTNITGVSNNDIIVYASADGKYVNKTIGELGIATTSVTSANASNISTNTSNISTNTSNIALKAPINNPTFTGTISGISSAMVGLGNVSNQSPEEIRSGITDSHIPSGITRDTELSAHTGATNPHNITKSLIGLGNVSNQSPEEIRSGITDSHIPASIARDSELSTHTGNVSNPHNVTKNQIGLGFVENKTSADIRGEIVESDIPASIARDSELSTHTSSTSNPHGTTASQVGAYTKGEVDALIETEDTLLEMNDTQFASLADNDLVAFDGATNKFTNQSLSEAGINKAGIGLGNVDNESKSTMFTNAALTGQPTAPTPVSSINNTQIATTAYVTTKISELLDGAPTSLNTLNEISQALNDSPNQINAILTSLAGKVNTGDVYTNTQVNNLLALQDAISELTDVNITSIGDTEILAYDSASGKFINRTKAEAGISTTADLNAHIAASNPHSVTKSDIGLGKVSNESPKEMTISVATQAALDLKAPISNPTFTGTITGNVTGNLTGTILTASQPNITGVGTIGTGVWQGTQIANAYVADLPTSKITSGTFADARIASSNITQHQSSITSVGTLSNLTVAGQVILSNTNGLEIQKGYFNSGGIRIKHDTSANNEFALAYEGDLSGSGEGTKNFKLQLKKSGSQISIIKFKPDGNVFVDGGNFGVGKTSPTSKLHVSGSTTLDNGVDMATGASSNYVGIGTSTKDRKLVIDGDVKIIKGSNHIANKPVLITRADNDTGTFIDFGGPVVVTHDLFKNSSVPGGFADNSNHFHTIQKIDRITAQGTGEVKNVERVQEQYYAIQSNNLRNDKGAFWTWHRVTRDVDSTDVSLSELTGWNVQNDQDFNHTSSQPNGRKQTEQQPFSQSKNTTFSFTNPGGGGTNNPFTLNQLLRVTVTTDFIGPFVAQTHFAKVTGINGDDATIVLYAGNYKTKDEVPISTDAGGVGTPQTALNDTTTFSVDSITTASYLTLATGTGLTVTTDSNRRSDTGNDFSKLVTFTTASAHNLQVNDTITIVTDGTGGFQPAEVAHVLTRDSATQVTCVYGRVFEPNDNVQLSSIANSAVVGILKGTLDGIHRYTAGDQLFTFWSNNVGRYKGYQIGPGSQADGDCIAIGKNTYNKDDNTIKIGYENNMLNIDSAGIDVAGTLDTTGNATIGGTLGTSDDITITKSSGTAAIKVSGQVAQLNLNDSDNSSEGTITNTSGDLYYVAEGVSTDYGNHFFMTQRASDNNAKAATMVIDGVNANVGIGTTTPDAAIKLDVNGTFRASDTAYLSSDVYIDTDTFFVDASTNKVQIGGITTNKQKGKLTVVGSNASGTGLAITHNTSTTDFVEMYYKGTASGGPFIMSRSQTGGAEIVLFNNGDINLNGGYKGVTSSANTSKTPDNVGIGVNAATKLNNGNANTNGKPTNKLHIFEKTGLTMGALETPNKDNALVRIEESTSSDVNMYLDGNMIYGSNVLVFTSDGDITLGPGKSQAAVFKTDGKVGIGVAAPTEALDVNGNIKSSGSVTGATLAGTLSTTAQPNIRSVGSLTTLTVATEGSSDGKVTCDALTADAFVVIGGGGGVSYNTNAFTVDTIGAGTFTHSVSAPTGTFTSIGGTLSTAAQTNITSVGTLTGLTSTGTIFGNFPDGSGSSLKLGRSDNSNYWLVNHAGNDFRLYNSAGSGSDILLGVDAGGTDTINNVGIKTATPTEALDVNGNILSNGVIKAINSSSNAAQLEVGRNGNEYIEVKVEDLNNRITAYQDADGNQEHNLIIDRQFAGSGANNLKIQKDGTDQVVIDTSGNLSTTGTIKSTSYEPADFPTTTSVRTTAAFKEDGTMVQDSKVIVKKITGAQAKAMTTTTSSFIEMIPTPGANKALLVREVEIFIDRGSWSPLSGGQVRGYGDSLELVIETPSTQSGFQYNSYAQLMKKHLNHTINGVFNASKAVDVLIVRDAPVSQIRVYPNKPLMLKPKSINTYAGLNTYSQTPDDDYYFRITYKVVDFTTDFAETTT